MVSFALPAAQYLGALPPDVATEPQLVLDSLYRVRYQGMDCAANIEAQARADATMPRRLFEYGARASIVHNLPVISIVLWLFKSKSVPRPPYRMYAGNRLVAAWDFINIELYKLSASAIINAGVVGLLPLVPFTQGASAEVVELAMRRVRDGAPEEQAAQLAALLGVFITRFHSEDLALNLVRRYFMSTEILQEFPLFRSMMADVEAKGEARGEARGEVKGMREAIARTLTGRFGSLSQEVIEAINDAEVEALNELALHTGTDTLEQLRARLGLAG